MRCNKQLMFAALSLGCSVAVACGGSEKQPRMQPASGMQTSETMRVSRTAQAGDLTDAQIAHIARLADHAQVEQAKIAQARAQDPAVRSFAALMLQDHTAAAERQLELFNRIGLKPTESDLAHQLSAENASITQQLGDVSKDNFDLAYMQAQVEAHERLLQLIRQQLLTNVRSPQVRGLLQEQQTTIESHLQAARPIQERLMSER